MMVFSAFEIAGHGYHVAIVGEDTDPLALFCMQLTHAGPKQGTFLLKPERNKMPDCHM